MVFCPRLSSRRSGSRMCPEKTNSTLSPTSWLGRPQRIIKLASMENQGLRKVIRSQPWQTPPVSRRKQGPRPRRFPLRQPPSPSMGHGGPQQTKSESELAMTQTHAFTQQTQHSRGSLLGRFLALLYGVVSYLIFFITFLYA